MEELYIEDSYTDSYSTIVRHGYILQQDNGQRGNIQLKQFCFSGKFAITKPVRMT